MIRLPSRFPFLHRSPRPRTQPVHEPRPMSIASLPTGRVLLACVAALATPLAPAAQQSTGALITGSIDLISIDDPGDVWSGGKMVVSGQLVVLPRNLLIDLPANRLTLQQLFADAPPAAVNKGVTGLAALDGPEFTPGHATILANRTEFGNVIAGEVVIEKGLEVVQGKVTFVDHTDGYLRVDGVPGDDGTGLMVRINDPSSRFTIQQGAGCDGGPNCSPDVRFGVDSDNYTVTFGTGYPAGIPSTIPAGLRPGFIAGDDAAAASDASGVGDPFCPASNRGVNPVPDSTRFAPIQLGDDIIAEGNFEFVNRVRFLSCHTLTVLDALTTRPDPTQPDYVIFAEAEWDVPAFDNQRIRALMIGFSTLNDSQLDVFRLHVDPATGENQEFVFGSTVGNPQNINQGIIPGNGGIWKIGYDADFIALIDAGSSPCQTLINAGFLGLCPRGGTLAENIAIMAPISREIIARTRHKATLLPGVITRDVNGVEAPNGEYLTPVGVGHPEFGEINLDGLQTPFSFDGVTWNLDRRLSPGGCDGDCEGTAQPLDPFPWSGRDPGAMLPAGSRGEIFQHFPFTAQSLVAWPPVKPGALAIGPTPAPGDPSDATVPPQADFSASAATGTAPFSVAFTDTSSGVVKARLWDFGDGSFSTAANPVHTYTVAGVYDVALHALGLGGEDVAMRANFVEVMNPGTGPDAPTANFTQDRTAGNVPVAVQFSDLSLGEITSWSWSFGDGATSSLPDPSHTYTTGGLFTVSLTVRGPGGANTILAVDRILANVPGDLDVDFATNVTSGVAPLDVRFRAFNISGQSLTGSFDFGDGSVAPVGLGNGRARHVYTEPGLYTVTLTASDGTDTDVEQKVGLIQVTAPLLKESRTLEAGGPR